MVIEITQVIRKFIADNFLYRQGSESIADTDSFLETDLIDSTGILELVNFIESTFAIQVADSEIVPENLDSIQSITRYIQRKLQESMLSRSVA